MLLLELNVVTEHKKRVSRLARSYRKPIAVDGYKSKWKSKAKQLANRAVRLDTEVSNGGNYKKVSNSWNICDYKFDLPNTKRNRSK